MWSQEAISKLKSVYSKDIEFIKRHFPDKSWDAIRQKAWQLGLSRPLGMPSKPTEDRFWSRVTKTLSCWLWGGHLDKDGYGTISLSNGTRMRVHRFSYELHENKIPDGLEIDHLCRIRNCVNPDHLEPVTTKENILRGEGFAAQNARRTHCKYSHVYDSLTPEGIRYCKACKKIKNKIQYEKRKHQKCLTPRQW